MERKLEEERKKEEEEAKMMVEEAKKRVMLVRVETFWTMQEDVVQKEKENDHLKERINQLQVAAQEERRTAEMRERVLREEIEDLENEKEDLQSKNEDLNHQVNEMETRAMDVAAVPSKSNPERPAPKTSSGSSLGQPRDKSGKFSKKTRN